uniref:Uncharacterized protein n=1 Tax=Anopheles maculatus TaxID=74869 RepID=A0A182T5Z6_9DIPT
VLPAVEPVVEEILDDDGDEQPNGEKEAVEGGSTVGAGAEDGEESSETPGNVKSPRQPEFQERQIDEDLFIQEPNIEVTDLDEIEDKPDDSASGEGGTANGGQGELSSLLRVKIKQEPKEEDEADEEDALFEDVGTIESSLVEVENPSPNTNTNAADEELYDDVIPAESIPSPSESSNQMGIMVQPKATIDGNVELQDAAQSAVVVPNKIKINITKTKQSHSGHTNQGATSANDGEAATSDANNGVNVNNFNEDAQDEQEHGDNGHEEDGAGSREERQEKNGSEQSNNKESSAVTTTTIAASDAAVVAFEETTDVAYELKECLKDIELNRQPRVTSGLEASGLCSIM